MTPCTNGLLLLTDGGYLLLNLEAQHAASDETTDPTREMFRAIDQVLQGWGLSEATVKALKVICMGDFGMGITGQLTLLGVPLSPATPSLVTCCSRDGYNRASDAILSNLETDCTLRVRPDGDLTMEDPRAEQIGRSDHEPVLACFVAREKRKSPEPMDASPKRRR